MSEKKVFRGWGNFRPNGWWDASIDKVVDLHDEPVTLLRDGPNGERGGLERWMVEYLMTDGNLTVVPDDHKQSDDPYREVDEIIATAIRTILEAE